MKLDMSNASRPSELFPIRWRCLDAEAKVLDIQETISKGKVRPYGKTKSSLTKVPITEVIAKEIGEYREECKREGKDTSPDVFMFPGRFGGPTDSSNYRHWVLHRLATKLGLPKLNFQVIRRTIATHGKNMGHSRDIQGLMWHTRLATTMDVYMQSLEPEVRKAINHELVATSTEGSTREPFQAIAPSEKQAFAIVGETRNTSLDAERKQAPERERRTQEVRCAARFCFFAGKVRANKLGGAS